MTALMTPNLTEARKALDKAKIALMSRPDSAFFTTVCFSLHHRFSEDTPTADVDGIEIRFNPRFFMALDAEERVFLLLHETLHAAYLHMGARQGSRCPDRWNIAGDHVINLQLIERGYKMPKNGHADKALANMSVEEVYDKLPDNPGKPSMQDIRVGNGCAVPGGIEAHMQDILVRAAVQSKLTGDAPGTIPGEIQIFLDRLLNPKLPWQAILRKFLNAAFAKDDYTRRKPNRRFFPQHLLPTLYSERLMDIAIAVDTSGSVSDEDFRRFVSEVHGILRMLHPEKITIVQFDSTLKSVDTVRNVADLKKIDFTGRGGTRIEPVLAWAAENKPQLLLVFSDGEFRFPVDDCRTRVVWLIHDNPGFAAPFGKTIHYSMKD